MTKICVVGLGYVGLPLAHAFDKEFEVIGFDVSEKKIEELKNNIDSTEELTSEQVKECNIDFTTDPSKIRQADFIIAAVPTPITDDKIPDMKYVKSASEIIGKNMKKDSIVVFESTVYPGATEEICIPLLEEESNMKAGQDFKVGYSPERINPGDKEHTVTKIIKVAGGMDPETTDKMAEIYGKVITAGIHKAPDIKTAEAAKVIENIQRDLNIALVNELSLIFEKISISTKDVIEAAGTKWNFHKYLPGLVGGHCIGVDPYYLTYKAQKLDYEPRVILAGRGINEFMSKHLNNMVLRALMKNKKHVKDSKVLVMGLTFKENCPDTRNSKIKDVMDYMKKYGIKIKAMDPLITEEDINSFGIEKYDKDEKFDVALVFSPHDAFKELTLDKLKDMMHENPVLIDVKGFYDKQEAEEKGFYYKTL
ncbi:nucleotide sugar dehydrogenase [Candidatus Woesearchaeota archaeon]|nr:nucleotide sugar dehydrogenase [Candidatus Woesearchaeota archaeon]